jgi:D-serine deaminase-like pyridoxal phosphate-dependent protein
MIPLFDQIDKPTLLLDEDITRRNIQRMVQRANTAGVTFRPHFKTHQSAEIGEWFRAEGVKTITVSSVDMAFYFAQAGWRDISIAFPANLRQSAALNELAREIHLGVLIESVETAHRLADTLTTPVDAWLKIDVGGRRTGLPWDQPEQAAQVAEAIQSTARLRLRGLLTHASQTYGGRGQAEVCGRYSESVHRIDQLRCTLAERGFTSLAVSVGDTPGTSLCSDLGPVDEIRPGNFVFYDAQQIQIGSCGWQDVAVTLACPVVARHPERGEVILYGGAVHLSKDFLVDGDRRIYGYAGLPEGERWSAPLPGAYMVGLSQEHGILHLEPGDLDRVQVGDLVCIYPAHSCLTVTLMKRYQTLTGHIIDTMNV